MLERKTVKFEVKEVDEEAGTFEGYAATFSKRPDSYGDIIDQGAFAKTIKEAGGRVKILFNHSVMEPIGKPTELSEDDKGLFVKGRLSLGVQRAREVLSLMKDNVITEMSIGYDTIKQTRAEGIRHLQEVRLWDTSPVVFAANPEAVIVDVKEAQPGEEGKSGRVLSAANIAKVQSAIGKINDQLTALQSLLDAAVEEPEPEKSTHLAEAAKEAEELEIVVATLKAENDGFDTKEAEKRIEAILEQLKI